MQQTYQVIARTSDGRLHSSTTVDSTDEALDRARTFAALNFVTTLEVPEIIGRSVERIGTFFCTTPRNELGFAVFARTDSDDPRLDLPELGTIGDLEAIVATLTSAGRDVSLEFPGFIFWSHGDREIGMDGEDCDWRVCFYTGNALTAGDGQPAATLRFPFTRDGRREAISAFYRASGRLAGPVGSEIPEHTTAEELAEILELRTYGDALTIEDEDERCPHGHPTDDACLDCAAEASNALAEETIIPVGPVTNPDGSPTTLTLEMMGQPAPVRVVVIVEEGLVQEVQATDPLAIDLVIIDLDTEGDDDADTIPDPYVHGSDSTTSEAYVARWTDEIKPMPAHTLDTFRRLFG